MNNATIQQITTSLIAFVVIVGTFGIVAYQVVNGKPVEVPTDISLLVGAVAGAFLTHGAAVNGARQAGVAAAQATAASTAQALATKSDAASTP